MEKCQPVFAVKASSGTAAREKNDTRVLQKPGLPRWGGWGARQFPFIFGGRVVGGAGGKRASQLIVNDAEAAYACGAVRYASDDDFGKAPTVGIGMREVPTKEESGPKC